MANSVLTMKVLLATLTLSVIAANAIAVQPLHRIAFGSCAMQTKAQPIWDVIAKQQPDLFLFIGDAIYADYDGSKAYTPTEVTLERDWDMLASEPHFKAFRQQVPIMATWDNHDYGKHDGGAEFKFKEVAKKYFLDFFEEPENSIRRITPGIYDAKIFGPEGKRVQVILLDTRYFKGRAVKDKRSKAEKAAAGLSGSLGKYVPNPDPNVTLLGEVQWLWLEQQLRKPAEVRLLVSSTQVIANEKGMDEWGNYPRERDRLLALITKAQAYATLFLSGNVHFTELSKLDMGEKAIFDFTSSGLTHTNAAYAAASNLYRVAGPYDGLNFGLVEIDWDGRPSPGVRMVAIDINGDVVFEHKLQSPQGGKQ